jgi:uncharacterized protein (TIGR02687 family)
MNFTEIKQVLQGLYAKTLSEGKKRHIVFWYDEEREFVNDIDELALADVKLIKVTANRYFAVKYQLEEQDSTSHYLIYHDGPKPAPKQNPLLDILKYSTEFSDDKTTVIMRNLGAHDESLRNIFKKYLKFFNNKERHNAFAAYRIENYTEDVVDIAVLSVLCKVDMPNLEAMMRSLFMEMNQAVNRYWEQIEKFGDPEAFWRLMEKYYGFDCDKTLEKLLVSVLVTSLSYTLQETMPSTWTEYLSHKKSDCMVFVNHFMNHNQDAAGYNALAVQVQDRLHVTEYLKKWDMDNYLTCDTFPVFDIAIISKLIEQVLGNIEEYNRYSVMLLARRTLHWYATFQKEYEAVYWAIDLCKLHSASGREIGQQSCLDFFRKYSDEYYKIDMAYRRFYAAFDNTENKEMFLPLRNKVENIYANWYLDELAVKWSNSVEEELKKDWRIPGCIQQQDFYRDYIKFHLRKGERVFVIISDAFRYEAAKEFLDILNTERKGSAEIFAMQGVLPSCTKLGMTSLLPHTAIELDEKNEYVIDGLRTAGTENRNKILISHCSDALALQYEDIINMSRQELRQMVQGKKVVYIYHNTIDARGDHAATEREVFRAVDDAFRELKGLVNDLVNSVSANLIYITADHGFIYKRGLLQESDKVAKEAMDATEEKRRYVMMAQQQEPVNGALCISMDYILGQDQDKVVAVPRGANRFKVQGQGANYVHGGAMLQEIVIPVIKFKNDRSKSGKHEIKKVAVKLTSISRKVTNRIMSLEFFQVEKIADKIVPLKLKVYFTDEEGSLISNEHRIIADSQSGKPEERTFREKFTLKSMSYDKRRTYYLILEDEDESFETIYEKIPFTIDIGINNDVGF